MKIINSEQYKYCDKNEKSTHLDENINIIKMINNLPNYKCLIRVYYNEFYDEYNSYNLHDLEFIINRYSDIECIDFYCWDNDIFSFKDDKYTFMILPYENELEFINLFNYLNINFNKNKVLS